MYQVILYYVFPKRQGSRYYCQNIIGLVCIRFFFFQIFIGFEYRVMNRVLSKKDNPIQKQKTYS